LIAWHKLRHIFNDKQDIDHSSAEIYRADKLLTIWGLTVTRGSAGKAGIKLRQDAKGWARNKSGLTGQRIRVDLIPAHGNSPQVPFYPPNDYRFCFYRFGFAGPLGG
jgi:hypothetical protein